MQKLDTGTEGLERVALNADVVDYSRLMADDIDATSRVMDRLHDLVDREVVQSGGVVDNFVGDSFMAVFDDPPHALRAAIAITRAVEEQNDGIQEARKLRFRMGIDMGPLGESGGQYFGDSLNIAARIQAIARPGGVSVSGSVYKALDEPALRFRSTGFQKLKNIPESVEVFEFAELPSDDTHRNDSRPLNFEAPTVAVLPMHISGLDSGLEGVPDLIRSDLLHRMATIPNLRLVDAGEDLESRPHMAPQYLLESGLHQVANQIRLYVQLLDVATMNVIASHKWSTSPDEVVDISERVAEETAFSIEVELIIGEPARDYSELDDPIAIQQIYQGWYQLTSMTPEGIQRALDLFGMVAEAHPEKPFGFALSAFTLWMGAAEGVLPDPKTQFTKAEELAQKATSLGDRTELAQLVQAALLMQNGHAQEAMDQVESVEMARPTCDVTYALAGSVRRYMGQWEESIDLLDRAMRLTAVNKPWYPTVKACSLYIGHRLEAASAIAESVLEYQPNNLEALLVLAASQSELGLDRRANATAAKIRELFPSVDIGEWLEQRPYQDRQLVDQWETALSRTGLINA